MNDNIAKPHESQVIGARIREMRLSKGWPLSELARRCGTSAPAIHRYESGWDRFEIATLRRLAAALGARVEIRLIPAARRTRNERPSPDELLELLAPLFWEKRPEVSDLHNYPRWVAARAIMFGSWDQVSAVRRYFGDDALRAAAEARGTDRRTRNFWRAILGGDEDASQSARR